MKNALLTLCVAAAFAFAAAGAAAAPASLQSQLRAVVKAGAPGERFTTPCGVAWGHIGNVPGYLVYAFSSTNGWRQAVLLLNEDPNALPKNAISLLSPLLQRAYCG